jgi:hypothetical protein
VTATPGAQWKLCLETVCKRPCAVDPPPVGAGLALVDKVEHPPAERPCRSGPGLLGFARVDGRGCPEPEIPGSRGGAPVPACDSRQHVRCAGAAGRRVRQAEGSKARRRAGTVAPRQRRPDLHKRLIRQLIRCRSARSPVLSIWSAGACCARGAADNVRAVSDNVFAQPLKVVDPPAASALRVLAARQPIGVRVP